MKLHINEDRIEKQIALKAAPSRVWRALTDYREFSEWFGVNLEAPFFAWEKHGWPDYRSRLRAHPHGSGSRGDDARKILLLYLASLRDRTGRRLLEGATDLSRISARKTENGTLLTVTESGFSKIPTERRGEAFRMNDRGWAQQIKDIQNHVEQTK